MSKRKHRPARPLPKAHGPTGQRFGLSVTEYTVGSWCPTPDGSGPAEAVAIQIMTNMPDVSFFMRLKSPAAVDEMIASLERHRRDVWPDADAPRWIAAADMTHEHLAETDWFLWDDGELPVPVSLQWDSTDRVVFASTGQLGWNRSQPVKEMGGYFKPIALESHVPTQ